MSNFFSHQEISFSPMIDDIIGSSKDSLRRDLIAGFGVALLTLPQAMAYALMAGLPLACGLFAAVLATCITAFFGSSRHLVVGPTNTIAILVQAGTAELLYTHYRDIAGPMREVLSLQIVTQLTILVGLFQMFAAFSGMGRLTQFVSHSVVVGYMTGTAIALGVNQLFLFCGFDPPPGAASVYQKILYLVTHLNQTEVVSLCVALACMPFLVYEKYRGSRLPAAGITLVVSGLFFFALRSYPELFGNALQSVQLVGDAGLVGPIWPTVVSVPFDMSWLNTLFPIASAIALLGMLEVSVIGKGIAAKSGQHLSVNQEIFGLGLGNFLSGFVGAMPSSGSSSRSFLNFSSGAVTRFAAAFSGIFVFLILLGCSNLLQFVPMGAFAAMLLVTAFGLVDGKQFLLCLRANGPDAFVLFVTILSCIIFSVNVAFFVGIGLSITFYLNKAASPVLVENRVNESGDMQVGALPSTNINKEIRMISVQGELFFGAADLFQTTLKTLAQEDQKIRVLIVRLKHARDVDATACLALLQLHRYLADTGRHLLICSITPPVWDVLCNSGVAEEIGRSHFFLLNPEDPQQAVKSAWKRARSLVAAQTAQAAPVIKPVFIEKPKEVTEEKLAELLPIAEGASMEKLNRAAEERAAQEKGPSEPSLQPVLAVETALSNENLPNPNKST